MPTLTTMTIRDNTGVHWFGALCPVECFSVDSISRLMELGHAIGCVDTPLMRECWCLVLTHHGQERGAIEALKLLSCAFNMLSAPGYSFRVADTKFGFMFGWWPEE